ncbi:hypothetical protein D6833_09275 [Candidatus Parcubacteria bacterium]|nr:MAG: hypothetical protein D6833_09275 [Candidatus Parcubacteria bacterium]
MFKNIFRVFVVLAVTVSFGFLKNVLLGRELSKADFGLFNLVMILVGFIYPLALLGQHNALVRVLSRSRPEDYDWKGYVHKHVPVMVLVAGALALAAAAVYGLRSDALFFLLLAILSSMAADLYSYILRAKGRYESSILLHRSVRIALPLAFLLLIYFNAVNLTRTFAIFGALYLAHALVVMTVTYRSTAAGRRTLTKQNFTEGLFILGSDLSLLVVGSVDKLFLGRMVSLEDVAIYFAILSLMRLFDLALQAIEYVLMPQSNKMSSLRLRGIVAKVFGVGVAITAFYVLVGGTIIQFVFAHKYDDGIAYIPYFCLIGMLRLLYTVPASIISGRLGSVALKRLVGVNSLIILVNLALSFSFIKFWHIRGALVSVAAVWLLRTCTAYAVFWRHQTDAPVLVPAQVNQTRF